MFWNAGSARQKQVPWQVGLPIDFSSSFAGHGRSVCQSIVQVHSPVIGDLLSPADWFVPCCNPQKGSKKQVQRCRSPGIKPRDNTQNIEHVFDGFWTNLILNIKLPSCWLVVFMCILTFYPRQFNDDEQVTVICFWWAFSPPTGVACSSTLHYFNGSRQSLGEGWWI